MNISKVEEKKQIKRDRLLASAYALFVKRGLYETSINDIAEYADVGKGTFYLYFKDKWDINEQVIAEKARLLFDEAIINADENRIYNFSDRLISIIDYIIDSFIENNDLIRLINKNLSLGLYNRLLSNEYINIKDTFVNELKNYNNNITNPDAVFYMIIELVGSTTYNSILNDIPLPIDEFKPYLYDQIRKMIN